MAVTDEQYRRLLARLKATEQHINDISVAIEKFVTLAQVNQLTTTQATELQDLRERVDSLESRVDMLENEPEI